MSRTHQRWIFILLTVIAVVLAAACQPSATPTPTPRPTATTVPPATATTLATSAAVGEATSAVVEITPMVIVPVVPTEEASAAATMAVTTMATTAEAIMTAMPTEATSAISTAEMTAMALPTEAMTMEMTPEMTMAATAAATTPAGTIIDVAKADGNFGTLLSALDKAGLTSTLSGKGPFTVFAPTDAAFSALLSSMNMTASDLLSRSDLADILKYHVVPGKVTADDLANYRSNDNPDQIIVPTLDGNKTLSLTFAADGTITINGTAKVTLKNVEASNGVIHVIDTVLMPQAASAATAEATNAVMAASTEMMSTPEATMAMAATAEATVAPTPAPLGTIIDVAKADGRFTTLLSALDKAGLTAVLSGPAPHTLFAPTNDAFKTLLASMNMSADDLLNRSDLRMILRYHIASGILTPTGANAATVQTIDGNQTPSLAVGSDNSMTINGTAKISVTSIPASNGVIYVIDTVLMPPTPAATAEPTMEMGTTPEATAQS